MKKSILKGLLTGVTLSASLVALASCGGGDKEAKQYIVSFNSNDPDTTDSKRPTAYNDISVTSGNTIDLSDYQPTYDGYAFDGWFTDDSFATEFTSSTAVTSDLSLIAKWVDTLVVTFETNGGGIITSQNIVSGSTATKPTNPTKASEPKDNHTKVVYTFDGWYTDSALTTAFDFSTTLTEDTTLYASYDSTLEAEDGYTLTTSEVLLSDYEVKAVADLTAFATDDGVFAFGADNNKNQIRDKNAAWSMTEYTSPTVTAGATGVTSVEVNKYYTIGGLTAASFTRSYVLGGSSADNITVTCAKDGYIAIYGVFTKGIGITDTSDSTTTTVTPPSTTECIQYIFNVKAGTYKIYRTSGSGDVFFAEYFSIVANA